MMSVNSSGPNSKDDVQDTHTQNLRQVDAAAVVTSIVEAVPSLHPAAAVFRDEILGNVGARNKALEENNARIRHLVDLIQAVKLAFHTKTCHRGQGEHGDNNNIYVKYHKTFTVKHQLSQGSIEAFDEEERLVLLIEGAPAHPLEDCGSIGSVRLELAGKVSGSFPPHARFYVSDPAQVVVEEDGSVRLILHLSEQIVIVGKLHSSLLSNEEIIECTEEPNFMTFLTTPLADIIRFGGEREYSKGIAFTPLAISIQVTPWMKETLALVNQMSSPHGPRSVDLELESYDGLRRLVVEALGDREHKELFNEYIALKSESNTLSELRNMMLGVTVRHSRGSFTVTLDKGEKFGDFWHIALDAGDRSAMTVTELSSMEVSVLGMQLHLSNTLELTRVSSIWDRDSNTWPHWFMQFQENSNLKFFMVVKFNWADLDDEEITEILTDFSSKMMNALGYRNADTAFPPSFEASVVGFLWELPLAENRLKMAGLWDEE